MPSSIDFYKGLFLHIIPVRIIVPCFNGETQIFLFGDSQWLISYILEWSNKTMLLCMYIYLSSIHIYIHISTHIYILYSIYNIYSIYIWVDSSESYFRFLDFQDRKTNILIFAMFRLLSFWNHDYTNKTEPLLEMLCKNYISCNSKYLFSQYTWWYQILIVS